MDGVCIYFIYIHVVERMREKPKSKWRPWEKWEIKNEWEREKKGEDKKVTAFTLCLAKVFDLR